MLINSSSLLVLTLVPCSFSLIFFFYKFPTTTCLLVQWSGKWGCNLDWMYSCCSYSQEYSGNQKDELWNTLGRGSRNVYRSIFKVYEGKLDQSWASKQNIPNSIFLDRKKNFRHAFNKVIFCLYVTTCPIFKFMNSAIGIYILQEKIVAKIPIWLRYRNLLQTFTQFYHKH